MRRFAFPLLLLLLTVTLRAPVLPWPAIEEDEAGHMVAAVAMAQGERPYVEAVVDQKPPLLWYLFSWVMKVAGPFNTTAIRLFTDLAAWATALLLWQLGRRLGAARAGRWAALLFTAFSTCSTYKILASNFELHFLPFDVAAYCCLVEALIRRRARWGIAAGAAIAVATCIKQTAGINLITQCCFLLMLAWQRPWRILALRTMGTLVTGFAVVGALFAWWMAAIGVFAEMRFWVWDFAWRFTQGTAAHMPFWSRLAERWGVWLGGTLIVHYWAMRWLLSAQNDRGKMLLAMWLCFEWIPTCLGGRFPVHYFLMYLPPLCLMAGLWVADRAALRDYFFGRANVRRWIARLALFCLPIVGAWYCSWRIEWVNTLYGLYRADHAKLARRIVAATQPTDRIFVWGNNPEFYWFARRLPATRFTWADYFVGRFGIPSSVIGDPQQYHNLVVDRAWSLLFDDFARHPPRLIIDTSPADLHDFGVFPIANYPPLADYLAKHYALAWVEDAVHFYLRRVE